MPDPISIFPIFVRDQAYPPTPTSVAVTNIDVTVADLPVTVAIDESPVTVTVTPLVIVVEGEG
jgi:hypothetical protein